MSNDQKFSEQLIVIKNEQGTGTKKAFHAKANLRNGADSESESALLATLNERFGIIDAGFEDKYAVWVKIGAAFVYEWPEIEEWVCAMIAYFCDWNLEDVEILRPDEKDEEKQGPTRLSDVLMHDHPELIIEEWANAVQDND